MNEFIICISNEGNPASLIVGKVYRTLSDADGQAHQMVRVLDEVQSVPEGDLHPVPISAHVELPDVAKQALTAAGPEV